MRESVLRLGRLPIFDRVHPAHHAWVLAARSAWRSRMMTPRRPDASSPGPSGPDAFSPTGGSCRRAALAAADIWPSCQQISSLTASGRSGAASPVALAAYAAAPRACAPICGTLAACPAARAAATAAGALTSRAAASATKRRRILGNAELATSEGPGPGDGLTGPAVRRSFGLEQSQHPLRAVRRPPRDDPTVGFAQRLRRDRHRRPRSAGLPQLDPVALRIGHPAKSPDALHVLRLRSTSAPLARNCASIASRSPTRKLSMVCWAREPK